MSALNIPQKLSNSGSLCLTDDRRKAMFELHVNMKQLNKFQVYSDNVIAYDQIIQSKGKFVTNRPDIYTPWLNEYGIFYTLKGPK